jgi:MFS family permease
MDGMPGSSSAGRAVGTTIKGARLTARGGRRTARWVGRNVGNFRHRGGAGDTGMMRLLDLHAASCAGDTLVAMGLAGTIFFNANVGEARGRVALYLLITMVPFALLAPIVGPLLDRFRHGRRYALAVTMLGRAFLAWLISDYIHGFGLYPAAFGVLALSRAYGVARSAAVPRLLPEGLGLSEAGARASVFGTVAGAVVAPIGLLAFKIGPQWPLRISSLIFLIGAVVAMRLPGRADSDPPEVPPRIFRIARRAREKVLQGPLVIAALIGSGALRALFGFLTLFLAFAIKSGDVPTRLVGVTLHDTTALALVVGALGVGSFVATAAGSTLSIRRPLVLQSIGIVLVAAVAIVTALFYSLGMITVFAFVTATASGLGKLAVDATIQERIPERNRASAFAHSETLLMLAWVLGGAFGLIPFSGRIGVIVAAIGMTVAAARSVQVAIRLRHDGLSGAYADPTEPTTVEVQPPPYSPAASVPGEMPTAPSYASPSPTPPTTPAAAHPGQPAAHHDQPPPTLTLPLSDIQPAKVKSRWWRRRAQRGAVATAPNRTTAPAPSNGTPTAPATTPRAEADQPTYHLYRPTGHTNNGSGQR